MINFTKLEEVLYEIPRRGEMLVSARFYSNDTMLESIKSDRSLQQLANIATLPGILRYALAMPDIHEGYGFPIGGVAAFDVDAGIISPGGVGYDINCGVRLLTTEFSHFEIKDKKEKLMSQLQKEIPSGVGSSGALIIDFKELDDVLRRGVRWALERGYARREDLDYIEANGCLPDADPACVSERAKQRGHDQLGTLGAGNHFLELQVVGKIFDQDIARKFGLRENQIVVMIHTGSRGLGHQVCTDYVRLFNSTARKYGIKLVDRELACAPVKADEGRQYFQAMNAAANFAWTNRQIITHLTRGVFKRILGSDNLRVLYDVAHNIAKIEEHKIGGKKVKVCVHRKGATRAFAARHPEIPESLRDVGQPVIIPGTMGTSSFVLVGAQKAMDETFGSVCHGAGRVMSRGAAIRATGGISIRKQLEERGIIVKCRSERGLAEESPLAYKDVDAVVDIVAKAGLANKVAQLMPLGVLKGE